MFSVERMKPTDFPFAVDLANTMNWNMTEADFAFNMQMERNGCFILKKGSKTVGLATCLSYGKLGWFGNLIIEDAYRKRGAGTTLVSHAVNYLHSVGVETVGLYAYAHLVNFYRNLGFEPFSEFSVLKTARIQSASYPNGQIILETPTREEISQIIELDETCFGSSRARLLTKILANKSNICFVAKEKDRVTGYVSAKVYEGMAEIGPLVCQRIPTKTASSLISTVAGHLDGYEAYLFLPCKETDFIEETGKFGFREEFRVVRMFLGSPVQRDCIYLAESLERG